MSRLLTALKTTSRAIFDPIIKASFPGVATSAGGVYTQSGVSNATSDFLGDWRSVDSWHRFDLMRVRNRSRELERGNHWAKSFKHSFVNNVFGRNGFRAHVEVLSGPQFGDSTAGVKDEAASAAIALVRQDFERAENFTTRKRLSRRDADILIGCRLVFDGEVILRKIRKFPYNDFGFTWQFINPDYLDANLNRLNPETGNYIKMGVELHHEYKFPVAYWFLRKRPNDNWFNYSQFDHSRYYRVDATEIIHIFRQDEDDEQTRGWPWLFAATVNLHRLGKFEEAALINATIGASKMGFFKKTVPDGFVGDPKELDDEGEIIDEVVPGTWTELPWNVEPVEWAPNYPDNELDPFSKSMLRGIAAVGGCSYASLSGDLSDTSFSSSRVGQNEEHEMWMQVQEFLIEKWKVPEYEEFVYRSLLARRINLPVSKFDKFKQVEFRGRRWDYSNPIQDWQAKQLQLDMCATSITDIIEETGGNRDEVFRKIAKDDADMAKLGIARIHGPYSIVDYEQQDVVPGDGGPVRKKTSAEPGKKV